MAKFKKRLMAIELRRNGLSIGVIAKKLHVSKASASVWCRNIKLTNSQKNSLIKNLGAQINKQKKIDIVNHYDNIAIKDIGSLTSRDIIIASAALYWAEGSKKENRFTFVNSDPNMVKFMFIFLTKILKINKNDIKLTIQINIIHKPRINKVLTFWLTLLQLPSSSLNKPYYVNTVLKKVYPNHDSYYGVLRLRVLKGSNIQYRVLGLIGALKAGVVQW